jgi:hypothetical protein
MWTFSAFVHMNDWRSLYEKLLQMASDGIHFKKGRPTSIYLLISIWFRVQRDQVGIRKAEKSPKIHCRTIAIERASAEISRYVRQQLNEAICPLPICRRVVKKDAPGHCIERETDIILCFVAHVPELTARVWQIAIQFQRILIHLSKINHNWRDSPK